jgi:hypothetical protein
MKITEKKSKLIKIGRGKVYLLLGWMVFLMGCNKTLDIDSQHVASESEQWNKQEDARSALMGIYGLTRAALAENNTHWICGELRQGDFSVVSRADLNAVVNNGLDKPYTLLATVSDWQRFYAIINAASIFLEKAPQIVGNDKSYSENNLELDLAQARALRAFAYFYMVRIWGDVPLITKSYDNGSFEGFQKSSASTILNFVKGELREIMMTLPYGYGSDNNLYYGQNDTYWYGTLFNKLAAMALLAHVAAWEGNYADVESYTKLVTDNASKAKAVLLDVNLLTASNGLFSSETGGTSKASKIIAFNFPFGANGAEATQSGHLEQLTLAQPLVQKSKPDIYVSKDSLYNIFKGSTDLRFGLDTATLLYRTNYIQNMNGEYPIFKKVNVIQNGSPRDNDYALFGSAIVFTRLEEIILLRAEALVALNRADEAVAMYNQIRTNRGFVQQSFKKDFDGDNVKVLKAVFEERRRELMGEGWRWYDQIRRQKLIKDDPKLLQLIDNGGIYWPVSNRVIANNPLITQNSYWR